MRRFGHLVLAGAALVAVLLVSVHDAERLQAQTSSGDRAILEAFYDATGGDDWTTSTNWKTSPTLGGWHGVQTDGAGRVIGLRLGQNNLTGSIPPGLENLSELTVLNLWGNELTGEIPFQLGNLTRLTTLSLSENNLTGSIPSELGNLSALQNLYLRTNQLTGSIPSELGDLRALLQLSLSQNDLTGNIPTSLGDLPNLQQLYLNENDLSGEIPSELGDLSALLVLQLDENQLTGSIPSSLGRLSLLQSLYLDDNQLTGSIPSELGDLTVLGRLSLNDNQLTGSIPSELGDITSLGYLYLYNNQLSGEIPSSLGGLPNLVWLYLNNNQLAGSIPPELGNVPALDRLYLNNNQLAGSIPPELGNAPALVRLNLSNNRLTGSIPSELVNLSALEYLYLRTNQLTGSIPPELGFLPALVRLYLNNNLLTGSIPPELGNSTLVRMYLDDNQLTGSIPAELGGMDVLTHLRLANNELTGEIPFGTVTGTVSPLEVLHLQGNRLTGEISPDLDAFGFLEELYLHDNQLSGTLPDLNFSTSLVGLGLGGNDLEISWSTFETGGSLVLDDGTSLTQSLQRLYLHDSSLKGSIPEWIGTQHTDLIELWLHDNSLTGSIPANFSDLTDLVDLRLGGNLLTGGWEALIGLPDLEELSLGLVASLFAGGSGRTVPIANGRLFLDLGLPSGADPSQSGVTLSFGSIDGDDVHVPPHPQIARTVRVLADSAVDITTDFRDAQGEPVSATSGLPAVVCLPVPSADAAEDMRMLKSDDGEVWRYLEAADPPSGYDPGAGNVAVCGMTDGFSLFVPAVVEVASGGSTGAGALQRISRIEPSISGVTVSAGDRVQLSFDIYGRQKILDNDLADSHVFTWDDGDAGGDFETTDDPNTIIYTAPMTPGMHTVTASSPRGACLSGENEEEIEQRCTAIFAITVRRLSEVPEERPAPTNPVGEIPSVLVDAEGRQYEVLTPEEGGMFDGGDVTLTADPGVVPNGEVVGMRVDAGGPASNIGKPHHRYSLGGIWYEIRAVDAVGSAISAYILDAPLSVCLPLPSELRSNISDVAIISSAAGDSQTVHASTVRIGASTASVCANVSTLPISIAVGRLGSPADLPMPTPLPTPEAPDTGGTASLSSSAVLPSLILGIAALILGSALVISRRQRAS